MQSPYVQLLSGSAESLRAQVDAAVSSVFEQGKSTLVVGLDALSELEDPAISALVRGLRALRAAGGNVHLVTASAPHRERLELTGLNRVFEVYATRREAETSSDDGRRPTHGKDLRYAVRMVTA